MTEMSQAQPGAPRRNTFLDHMPQIALPATRIASGAPR